MRQETSSLVHTDVSPNSVLPFARLHGGAEAIRGVVSRGENAAGSFRRQRQAFLTHSAYSPFRVFMELAEPGATIRRNRLASGINEAQLARMAGVSRATINYAETGRSAIGADARLRILRFPGAHAPRESDGSRVKNSDGIPRRPGRSAWEPGLTRSETQWVGPNTACAKDELIGVRAR